MRARTLGTRNSYRRHPADLDRRADDFVNPDRGVLTRADALLGAGHILAEQFSERATLRQRLRDIFNRTGHLVSLRIDPEPTELRETSEPVAETPPNESATNVTQPLPLGDPSAAVAMAAEESTVAPAPTDEQTDQTHESAVSEAATPDSAAVDDALQDSSSNAPPARPAPATTSNKRGRQKKEKKDKKPDRSDQLFRDYFDYREPLSKIPPHRVLAINRGEKAKVLRVRIDADFDALERTTDELLVPSDHPHADFLRGCGRDALARLVLPSLEREIRRELTDRADTHAVQVFARNLRHLLLQLPVRNRRLLAIDPGFRSGCNLAALDEFGNLLEHAVVHLVGKPERRAEAPVKMVELITKHELSVVVIGNGTACRQTEELVARLIADDLKDRNVAYVIVNEAGASVYSASRIGREEFPNYDATLRGTISIGRRLQDPLSELVKIDPANIGVGLYQHDVKAKHLRESLEAVVESCVNFVGVDLNTASPSLLQAVSGLNQLTARRLYDYRVAHGPFGNREQLKDVPGFGEATFTQAAGFLKIVGGDNPLDTTWIHPESYEITTRVVEKLGAHLSDLADKTAQAQLAEKATQLDADAWAKELNVGTLTLRDILANLVRPGRDPREDLPPPIFKRGVLKLEDLEVGMELSGTVLNVVDFGAFVDIGLSDSGLVHISQLANKYVPNPHEVVAVGDIVKVWVLGVDKQRRRVSLTMIEPGTERAPEPRPEKRATGGENRSRGRRERPRTRKPAVAGGAQAKKPPRSTTRPQRKPSFVPATLSQAKQDGKEPLRTFGELKRLFELKSEDPVDEAK